MTVGLASIVEGHGEVGALPVLVRRLAYQQDRYDLQLPRPVLCSRSEIITPEGTIREDRLERRIRQAQIKLHHMDKGAVLLLLDADDDCPKTVGPKLQEASSRLSGPVPVIAVLANREFEAWFLAAIESLRGRRGIPTDALVLGSPEGNRDAKGVLNTLMGGAYSERIDQSKLAAVFDFGQAARCRSFRKFQSAVSDLLGQL